MSKLHQFILQKHYTQFRDFLVESVPTTTPLLGWLLGTGFFDSDHKGKCSIWTSHPDPFQSNDPVVWIFDSSHRIRVFVTSEFVLDSGTFTPEARELTHKAVYKDRTLPNYFVEHQLEVLYIECKKILKSALEAYFELDGRNVLIHGVNVLWCPVFHEVLDVQSDGPCFKFVKPVSSLDVDNTIALPHGLEMTKLQHKNVDQVQCTNKIPYYVKYIEDCLRVSSAIRRVDKDEMVAWSMTHRDFFVGCLHVLPEYRRRGYADIILQDLCKQHAAFYNQVLPGNASKLYFGAAVETYNTSSANLFRKTGWIEYGLGITWIIAKVENK